MINCIIVEDSPLAVEKLKEFIQRVPNLQLLQSFENGIEAIDRKSTRLNSSH